MADAINAQGSGKASYRLCDVVKRDEVNELVRFAEKQYEKPVDVLINNAG